MDQLVLTINDPFKTDLDVLFDNLIIWSPFQWEYTDANHLNQLSYRMIGWLNAKLPESPMYWTTIHVRSSANLWRNLTMFECSKLNSYAWMGCVSDKKNMNHKGPHVAEAVYCRSSVLCTAVSYSFENRHPLGLIFSDAKVCRHPVAALLGASKKWKSTNILAFIR